MRDCRSTKTMKITGQIKDITRDLNGHLLLSMTVEAAPEQLGGLRGETLDIELDKKRNKRSTNANAYLWVICDKIAKRIGNTSKERIYLGMLRDFGIWEDILVKSEASEKFCRMCRYNEVMYEVDGWTCVRVYEGSHTYNTKEMSELLNGVVSEAQLLGIETMTPDELARLAAQWKGHNND